MDIFQSQLDAIFSDSDPTKVYISHALDFAEHCQEIFAITRIFISQVDFIFSVVCQSFAVGLADRMVLFLLVVSVDGGFIMDRHDYVSLIFQTSALHVFLVVILAVD